MNVLSLLTPDAVIENFGRQTYARGLQYADGGAVTDVQVTDHGEHFVDAVGQARGSRARAYVVQLEANEHQAGIEISTLCSCPMSYDCKHGAALALLLGRRVDARTDWQTTLAGLFDDLDQLAPPLEPPPGVALELSLEQPRYSHGPQEELRLRPMRPGARQKWVKTGLGWTDVPAAQLRRTYDPDQLAQLLRLQNAMAHSGHYGYYAGEAPPLDAFGTGLVGLLHDAVAAGIVLVAKKPLLSWQLSDEPARLGADATRDDDGDTHLRLGLVLGDELRWGDQVQAYGDPAHTASFGDRGHVTLAALEPRLTGGPLRAITREQPVVVPADGAGDLPDHLRRLGQLVSVGSRDGSVEIPDRVAPTLRVTVTWDTAAAADVLWEWCYGTSRFPIDSSAPPLTTRDRAAERALLATISPPPHLGRQRVTGPDALHLALLELPVWRAVDDVEVVEVAAPEFREAEDGPEFSFEAPEPDGADRPTDWLDLEVVITVDGERILLASVLEALTLGHEHLVLPSGLYVRTDRPEFARLGEVVRAAAELHERDGEKVRVTRHDLGLWAQLADLGVVDTQAAEWVARAQALRDLVELPTPEPTGVRSTLRSYQLDGFHWLAFLWQHGLGGILADDMGLGKTLQVLALIAHTRATSADTHTDPGPFLVVAPTSVVSAWVTQAGVHTPDLRVRAVTSSSSRRDQTIAEIAADADVVVTTYTLLRLEEQEYADVSWAGLVLDEAQQVKNHQSKAYAAVRKIDAPFRLAVTGTPFENRLLELWSLLSITAPGLYPHPRGFVEHVVRPVEKEGDALALKRLTRRIKPFVLRRTKEVVAADLPPKQEQVLEVNLGPQHRKLYDAHLAKERQRILGLLEDFNENRVAVLAALTKLRQLALDPALLDADLDHVGSAKIDVLAEHLREIRAEGHRALVFSSFTGFLKRVRARLDADDIPSAYLDGATLKRGDVIEEFRSGSAPVFLISLKAGGVGLTLTEADYVFVLDPWWNPAAEAQAVDRAHRIGQTRTVMVYRLVSTDTIEEKVMALKARKARLFAQVIDGEAGLSAGISADDIRALFD